MEFYIGFSSSFLHFSLLSSLFPLIFTFPSFFHLIFLAIVSLPFKILLRLHPLQSFQNTFTYLEESSSFLFSGLSLFLQSLLLPLFVFLLRPSTYPSFLVSLSLYLSHFAFHNSSFFIVPSRFLQFLSAFNSILLSNDFLNDPSLRSHIHFVLLPFAVPCLCLSFLVHLSFLSFSNLPLSSLSYVFALFSCLLACHNSSQSYCPIVLSTTPCSPLSHLTFYSSFLIHGFPF